jgi:LuxR family transcriptional regulator, maltose regulon positive regulatory protein
MKMPYQQMPWVRQGQLVLTSGKRIVLDTPAWFAWLSQVSSFCYSGSYPLWRLTVRREKRRQQFYWYAYCKIDGKLHNIYLGKQDTLTKAHLEQACQLIDQRARKEALLNQHSPPSTT